MTEEIIKECKNCDALGIDSEIGVYYCCLSHRQDDLPKEFTCNDFTPDKQLKRLEQENKELRREIAELRKDCNHCNFHTYRSALEKIRTEANKFDYWSNNLTDASNVINEIKDKVEEVLNEGK